MNRGKREKFGATFRRERERLGKGLNETAKVLGVSPTYLSKIERDQFPPPAEDKIVAMAKFIGRDTDEYLALAGKVSSDLTEIIKELPRETASLLRGTRSMAKEERSKVIESMVEAMRNRNLPDPD